MISKHTINFGYKGRYNSICLENSFRNSQLLVLLKKRAWRCSLALGWLGSVKNGRICLWRKLWTDGKTDKNEVWAKVSQNSSGMVWVIQLESVNWGVDWSHPLKVERADKCSDLWVGVFFLMLQESDMFHHHLPNNFSFVLLVDFIWKKMLVY